MNNVTILAPDGSKTTCEPTFEAVKAALDGAFITPMHLLDEGTFAFVDEDGLLKQLPINEVASRLAGQVLVGKVAVVSDRQLMRKILG